MIAFMYYVYSVILILVDSARHSFAGTSTAAYLL